MFFRGDKPQVVHASGSVALIALEPDFYELLSINHRCRNRILHIDKLILFPFAADILLCEKRVVNEYRESTLATFISPVADSQSKILLARRFHPVGKEASVRGITPGNAVIHS